MFDSGHLQLSNFVTFDAKSVQRLLPLTTPGSWRHFPAHFRKRYRSPQLLWKKDPEEFHFTASDVWLLASKPISAAASEINELQCRVMKAHAAINESFRTTLTDFTVKILEVFRFEYYESLFIVFYVSDFWKLGSHSSVKCAFKTREKQHCKKRKGPGSIRFTCWLTGRFINWKTVVFHPWIKAQIGRQIQKKFSLGHRSSVPQKPN